MKNRITATPIIVEVPGDERKAITNAYKKSQHEAYFPLTGATEPHRNTWNRASTLLQKHGRMPVLYIEECRMAMEYIPTADKVTEGIDGNLKVSRGAEVITWI